MGTDQMQPWSWYQCRQPLHGLQQLFTFRFAAKTRNDAKRRWRISLFRMLAV